MGQINISDLPVQTRRIPELDLATSLDDADQFLLRQGSQTNRLTGATLKELNADYAAKGNFCEVTGSLNNYVMEPAVGYSRVSSLQDGMRFYGEISATNTGAMTVNTHGTGVKNVVDINRSPLHSGYITGLFEIQYDLAEDEFVLLTPKDHQVMVVRETNASTGTFVGSGSGYRQRRLNTVVQNDIVGASLLNFEITLPAGSYIFDGYFGYQAVNNAFEYIYNVTDAQYENGLKGSSGGANDSSFIKGYIDIPSEKVFSSYGYLSDSGNTGVNATPVSVDNIYACLTITKIG